MSFTPNELRQHVVEMLNQGKLVPNGHKGAFITYIDDSGMRTILAYKPGKEWEVSGTIGWHEHQAGLDFGINVMKTW